MATVYDLKPRFQRLLRPLVSLCLRAGIGPNAVTAAGLALSLAGGAAIWVTGGAAWIMASLPLLLLIRMGLNAIDGMVARQAGKVTRAGMVFNEGSDIVSDLALYVPFLAVSGVSTGWITAFAAAMIMAEAAGLFAQYRTGTRAYDGPFGKSDRAVLFGLFGVMSAAGFVQALPGALPLLLVGAMVALSLLTIANRWRRASGRPIKRQEPTLTPGAER